MKTCFILLALVAFVGLSRKTVDARRRDLSTRRMTERRLLDELRMIRLEEEQEQEEGYDDLENNFYGADALEYDDLESNFHGADALEYDDLEDDLANALEYVDSQRRLRGVEPGVCDSVLPKYGPMGTCIECECMIRSLTCKFKDKCHPGKKVA